MNVLRVLANMATSAADDMGEQVLKNRSKGVQARAARLKTSGNKFPISAAEAKRHDSIAGKVQSDLKEVNRQRQKAASYKHMDEKVTRATRAPRAVGRGIGTAVGKVSRGAGVVAEPFGRAPGSALAATVVVGAGVGIASGVRSSFRDINSAAGNPVGVAANMSIQGAFSGNPSNSRSRRGGANGSLTYNMSK